MTSSKIKFPDIFGTGRFSDLLELCDGTILTDDGYSFNVHKVVLACCSDYFRAMFCGMDKGKREYRISNINGECMHDILLYIYANDVCVTENNVKDLLKASDYFLLKELYSKSKEYAETNITLSNCLKLCHTAYQLNEKDIVTRCMRMIKTGFEEFIVNQRDVLSDLPYEWLKNILCSRNLNVESERTVWQVIVHWTNAYKESRLQYVPSLLSCLALDEIGHNLAREILNHQIVTNNLHVKPLKDLLSSKNSYSDCDLLLNYLHEYPKDFQLQKFRIPQKINIISKYTAESFVEGTAKIYISYDETHCFWRQISQVDFQPEYLTIVGSELYMFEKIGLSCVNFNLRNLQLKYMQIFDGLADRLLAVKNRIYTICFSDLLTYDIKLYDAEENSWLPITSFGYVSDYSAVVMDKNILIVGNTSNLEGMFAELLDLTNQQWVSLSAPKFFRHLFRLVAYDDKIYLIGGLSRTNKAVLNVEVYNPRANCWMDLPDLPFTYPCTYVTVLNDQMIVYDFYSDMTKDGHITKPVRWNMLKTCWETLEKLPKNMYPYRFCTLTDVETIKFLTKQNRSTKGQFRKSPFDCI